MIQSITNNLKEDGMKVGVIGSGHLAQLLAQAGLTLGIETHCIAESYMDCAGSSAILHVIHKLEETKLHAFTDSVEVITCEYADHPLELAEKLAEYKPLFPTITSLHLAHDRYFEKTALREMGIPTTDFFSINTEADLTEACNTLGFPCLLKTRREGHESQGQALLHTLDDVKKAWETLNSTSLILEKFIAFDEEISLTAVRNGRGDRAYYALTKHHYNAGKLVSTETLHDRDMLEEDAHIYAHAVMDKWNHVGVITLKFFVKNNSLYVNKVIPGLHNAALWTQEGAVTSQFENHLRAILNLSLGDTRTRGSVETQLIRSELPPLDSLLSTPNARVHLYGKKAKQNAVLGHVTYINEFAPAQKELQMNESFDISEATSA